MLESRMNVFRSGYSQMQVVRMVQAREALHKVRATHAAPPFAPPRQGRRPASRCAVPDHLPLRATSSQMQYNYVMMMRTDVAVFTQVTIHSAWLSKERVIIVPKYVLRSSRPASRA